MTIRWANSELDLLPERAVYRRDTRSLIFSDVHLGKAHDFQALGVPIPATVHVEDLERIAQLVERLRPDHVYILGDFVHSYRTELEDLRARFVDLTRQHPAAWHLILGNHDRHARSELDRWGFREIRHAAVEKDVHLVHDPGPERPAICGHVHPVVRVGRGRDRLRLPCFVVSPDRLLLPSFGEFTGGFEVRPSGDERIYGVGGNEVLFLPESAYR